MLSLCDSLIQYRSKLKSALLCGPRGDSVHGVDNPAHSLYVIKPHRVRGWVFGVARVESADVTPYIA